MVFLRQLIVAAVAAVLIPALQATEPADHQFEVLSRLADGGLGAMPGQFRLYRPSHGRAGRSAHRMAFNQVAEGWSWRPLADPEGDNYYRYKFLPLRSVMVERGEYVHEDKIGVPQLAMVTWHYGYFLAFENLHDFYRRVSDDDAGFGAELPAGAEAHLGMRARARLIELLISESTTFLRQPTTSRPTSLSHCVRIVVPLV